MEFDDIMMKPIADLMWTAEEEADPDGNVIVIVANCGGKKGACCSCSCSASLVTKYLCNG